MLLEFGMAEEPAVVIVGLVFLAGLIIMDRFAPPVRVEDRQPA